MRKLLKLPEEEQRTIFRNTAQKMGVHEAIIEKDYWVCVVLEYLFHHNRFHEHLSFKGGTSLSKCFSLISRFSEDLDLILDWRLLWYDKDEPWQKRSKTKQAAFNTEADAKAEAFLANEFLPTIITDLTEVIGKAFMAEIDKSNPQTINIHYPQLFNTESILQMIRLEIGALAAWTPSIERRITPYIFEQYPQLPQAASTLVVTSSAERSFWEKATILHHEANRPESSEMPSRYSRHYYDLFCIAQTEYKASAMKQLDLLERVIDFKMRFYPRTWAKYEEATLKTIRLVPPLYRIDSLRKDYIGMAELLFGSYPTFEQLMGFIENLETELNNN